MEAKIPESSLNTTLRSLPQTIRVAADLTNGNQDGADALDSDVEMNHSCYPFISWVHYVAWCYYHSNFVPRDQLPDFLVEHQFGLTNTLQWSNEEFCQRRQECIKIINEVKELYPLITPVVYTDQSTGRKMTWVRVVVLITRNV